MISQLRIYTINRGKLDDFVEGWKKFVYPLHYQFGFTIPQAWVIRERNEFVWIVSYGRTRRLGRQASGLLRFARAGRGRP